MAEREQKKKQAPTKADEDVVEDVPTKSEAGEKIKGELDDLRRVVSPPMVPAVAIRGEGVVETLHALLTVCYRSLDRNLGLDTRWRISERWWPQPIDREYVRVTGPGWLALIFRDLLSGGWFLERIYD